MKTIKYLLILTMLQLLCVHSSPGQNYLTAKWLAATNTDNSKQMISSQMCTDSVGHIFIAGTSFLQIDEDQTDYQVFVHCYDTNGIMVWQQEYDLFDRTSVTDLDMDSQNNLYLCGIYKADTIDPVDSSSVIVERGFVSRIHPNGQLIWTTTIDSSFSSPQLQLALGDSNQLYLAASVHSPLDSSAESKNSLLMIRLDADSCGIVTHKQLPVNGHLSISQMLFNDQYLYLTGSFSKQFSMDSLYVESSGLTDAYLLCMDKSLNGRYLRSFGQGNDESGECLHVSDDRQLIWAGYYRGTLRLEDNQKLNAFGGKDIFIGKVDPQGDLEWIQNIGSLSSDIVRGISTRENNSIYLLGDFRGGLKKEAFEILSSGSSYDSFIAKFNGEGNLQYIESIGDTNTDLGQRLLMDSNQDLIISGNYQKGMKIFDLETDSLTNNQFYLSKLYDCHFSSPVNLPMDTVLCGDEFMITADSGFVSYWWNGSMGENTHWIDTTGYYILEARDEHKCISRDSIFIQLHPLPKVDLGEDMILQYGEGITLRTSQKYPVYQWSTGSTDSVLTISGQSGFPGSYPIRLLVYDSLLCEGEDEIILTFEEKIDYNEQVIIYPNPTQSTATIQISHLPSPGEVRMELIDGRGTVINIQKAYTAGDDLLLFVDLSAYQAGSYYVKIIKEDFIREFTIVKSN